MKKVIRTALALFAASVVIGPGEYFLALDLLRIGRGLRKA
jgi:hypothetical protein